MRAVKLGAALLLGASALVLGAASSADAAVPDVIVVGGPAAVSNGVVGHLESCTSGVVERRAGTDRFATAATLSEGFTGVDTVFIATGANYPDAITAGSPAALKNAPILLTNHDTIPGSTWSALDRLAPSEIVLLGGTTAISERVEDLLRDRFASVLRLGGADRYETSSMISAWAFPDPADVDTVYVADGSSYADAIVGGSPATRDGAPVLLIARDHVPTAASDEIERLDPDTIVIVGGQGGIGAAVESELAGYTPDVRRMVGASRWATAANAAKASPPAESLFIVTGDDFPDGLAALPAANGAPILLVRATEVHSVTGDAISRRTGGDCGPWTPPYPQVGSGKRVIYSLSEHQLWMVDEHEQLVDTYPVTGRVGIPHPGTYEVFSKSIKAYAPYGGITMDHMVRFVRPYTWGNQWSYGFHSIPRYANGVPLQTVDELGGYGSGGCVRQSADKAEAMYAWADIGTTVIVLP